jgi:glutamine amidotransferase
MTEKMPLQSGAVDMIRIVDYEAGNLTSVKRALDFLGAESEITADPAAIAAAARVIFPGVGHAGSAMAALKSRGLDEALQEAHGKGTPVLGICLGMKIPHMGWNEVTVVQQHPILKDLRAGDEFYFVHAYYPQPLDEAMVYATTEYETIFPSVIGSGNLVATQFHPEKSGRLGLAILKNFLQWDGGAC